MCFLGGEWGDWITSDKEGKSISNQKALGGEEVFLGLGFSLSLYHVEAGLETRQLLLLQDFSS